MNELDLPFDDADLYQERPRTWAETLGRVPVILLTFLWIGLRPMICGTLHLVCYLLALVLIVVAVASLLFAVGMWSHADSNVALRLLATGWCAGVLFSAATYIRHRISLG